MDPLDHLRQIARQTSDRAVVPFSRTPVGVALLLSDGVVMTGARIESASYPLTIPALQAAWARTRAAGRSDLVAVASSRPLAPAEQAFLSEDSRRRWHVEDGEVAAVDGFSLHAPTDLLDGRVESPEAPMDTARWAATHAYAPVSHFPVGCVMETDQGW
ncbi:MAG: hypothetical protein AAFQ43_14680, partial [Bacteroidota bacterium]